MLESINFHYNGTASTSLNLYNVTLNSGLFEEPFLAPREIKTEIIRGRDKPYFFGVQKEPISFKLSFAFNISYTDTTLRQVASWFDQTAYKPFYFDDMPNRIYYCILSGESTLVHTGNNEGYCELEFICDSPYSYGTLTTGTAITSFPTTFVNSGDVDLYPELWIVTSSTGCSITNSTSGDSVFAFSNVATYETIYIDNENQDIITNLPLTYRYDDFNNNWLRLIPGNNVLSLSGISSLQFRYKFKYLQGCKINTT